MKMSVTSSARSAAWMAVAAVARSPPLRRVARYAPSAIAPMAEACGPLPTASATPSQPPSAIAQWSIQSPPTS